MELDHEAGVRCGLHVVNEARLDDLRATGGDRSSLTGDLHDIDDRTGEHTEPTPHAVGHLMGGQQPGRDRRCRELRRGPRQLDTGRQADRLEGNGIVHLGEPSPEQIGCDIEEQIGAQAERLDVDAFVVAVEPSAERPDVELRAEQPCAVGHRAHLAIDP